jgi:HlyD family secretion protein
MASIKAGKKKLSMKIVWGIVILAILVGAGYYYYSTTQKAKATAKTTTASLHTTTAKQGDLVIYASGTGNLVAVQTASLSFGTDGTISKLNVKLGDSVKKGDVLAELDSASATLAYEQARRTLLNLTSASNIATAENAAATAATAVVTAKQTLQYEISPQVFSYEQKLADAEDALTKVQQTSASDPSDANTKAVTDAQAAVDKAKKSLKSAQYWYKTTYVPEYFTTTTTNRQTRTTTKYLSAPTDEAIASVRAQYALAKATLQEATYYVAALKGEAFPDDATGESLNTFVQAQLAVKSAQETLDQMKIVAPFDGSITAFSGVVGNATNTSTSIMTISDESQPIIDFYLDESDYANVAVGYEVEVTFDAINGKTFTGKVIEVDPTLSDQNGSYLVHGQAQLDSISDLTKEKLMLGMNASTNVIGGKATNAVLVSVDALHKINDTPTYGVFVYDNGTLKFKEVEVGIQDTFNAEIKSGLKVGDVVTTGLVESN